MPDSEPALTAAETELAAGLLAAAWGEHTEISAAELIWNRRHIVRLRLGSALVRPGSVAFPLPDWWPPED